LDLESDLPVERISKQFSWLKSIAMTQEPPLSFPPNAGGSQPAASAEQAEAKSR
jgi:hypothetical protein